MKMRISFNKCYAISHGDAFLESPHELDAGKRAAEDYNIFWGWDGVVCPFVVEGEDALLDYGKDDWDGDAEEFEGESNSFEERHFVELST